MAEGFPSSVPFRYSPVVSTVGCPARLSQTQVVSRNSELNADGCLAHDDPFGTPGQAKAAGQEANATRGGGTLRAEALEVPRHLARRVHDLYFSPQYPDFEPRTLWSLSNAFTSAFKDLDPIPQFRATAKLGSFLDICFKSSF